MTVRFDGGDCATTGQCLDERLQIGGGDEVAIRDDHHRLAFVV